MRSPKKNLGGFSLLECARRRQVSGSIIEKMVAWMMKSMIPAGQPVWYLFDELCVEVYPTLAMSTV
jgi:hypothetical protein